MMKLADRYRYALPAVLRWRWLVLISVVVLMSGALHLVGGLSREFLPALDDGEVRVSLRLPSGTPPEDTLAAARQIESLLLDDPHVQTVFTLAGGTLWGGTVTENSGLAQFLVQLVPASQRPNMPAGRWIQQARQSVLALDIPGGRVGVRPPQIRGLRFTSSGDDIVVGLTGPNLDQLEMIGRDVYDRLQGIAGLENLEFGDEDRSPLLEIRIDRDRAARAGLGVADIGAVVRTALDGGVATRFLDRGQEYDVRVRLRRDEIDDTGRLGDLIVATQGDQTTFLRDVARLDVVDSPATIWRENQSRIVRVTADLNPSVSDISTVITEIQARLSDIGLPDGYNVLLGGQWETIQDTNRELTVVIGLAILLVFAVMAVQYERISSPLIILLSAPLALIGVIGILWITSTPLSAPALIGLLLLVGIVVNNAILLVEYIESGRREQNMPLQKAIVEAGATRLRPILMTTLTTILGMSPLAIGIGEGADIMRPLALAVIGGLSTSMLLTLVVIPCLYFTVHIRSESARQHGVP